MTERDVNVLDPESPWQAQEDWQRIQLPRFPVGAAPIAEINWATSGPGIDWPAAYALGWGGEPSHTILWVFDPDGETNPVGLDWTWYPGAWSPATDESAQELAETLLGVFWSVQAEAGQTRPQEILLGGVLDEADLGRIANTIWSPVEDMSDQGADTYDDPEIQALYQTFAPMFSDKQRAVDAQVASRRAARPEERRLYPFSELQRAAGRLLLRTANTGDFIPEPEVGCEFIGDLAKGTPLVAWAHLDASLARICTLWLHYVAGHQAICVRVLGKTGNEGTVYGLVPPDASRTEQFALIRELFARNGHQKAPLFPSPPDLVLHHENAPGQEAAPEYGVKETQELFSLIPIARSNGFDEWFKQVTEPRRVREIKRIVSDF